MNAAVPILGETRTAAGMRGRSRVRPRATARRLLYGTLAALLLVSSGCDRREAPPADEKLGAAPGERTPAFAVEASASQGNSTLSVRVSAAELTVAQRLIIECEVVWPAAVAPQWPKELDALNGFVLVDRSDSGPETTADGRFRFRRTLTLEPFLSGDREIPALAIDLPAEGGPGPVTPRLGSRPIPIRVDPVVTDAPTKPEDLIKALAGPSTLPATNPVVLSFWQRRSNLALLAGGVLLGGPLLVASVHLVRRRRAVAPESPMEALRRLAGVLETSPAGKDSQPLLDDISQHLRSLLGERLGASAHAASMTELADARSLSHVVDEPACSAAASVAGALDRARFAPDPSDRHAAALAIASALRTLLEHWPAQTIGAERGGKGGIA